MLQGALIGLLIGLIVGLYQAFFVKGKPCPQCGKPRPVPWFTPPRQCPACGAELGGQPTATEASAPRKRDWLPITASLALAVGGIVLVVLFLGTALESRRVWLYQQGRVDEVRRQIEELEFRPDQAARQQRHQLEEKLRRNWSPDIYQDDYRQRLWGVAAGVLCLLAAVVIPLVRWRSRSARPLSEQG